MNPKSANWAVARATQSLRVALLAYASVIVLALGHLGWAAGGMPKLRILDGISWMLACALAALGIGFVRIQRERIARGGRPAPSWPAGVLAVVGLVTNAIYMLLLAIGWFEIYQARCAFDLVPGRDRSAPAA